MITKRKLGIIVGCLMVTLLLVEPTLAEEPSEQVDDIDWVGLIESLLQFFADLLEAAAEGVRRGVEVLKE